MPKKMPNLPRAVRHVFLGAMVGLMGALLAGCWDRTEIEDLTIILSAAFDKTEQGGVQVSLEVLYPRAAERFKNLPVPPARREGYDALLRERSDHRRGAVQSSEQRPRYIFWGMRRFISSVRIWPEKGCLSISTSCSASNRRGCMPSSS